MNSKFAAGALCAAAVALMGPVAAYATDSHGVDMCMQKFVSEHLPEGVQVRVGPSVTFTAADFRLGNQPRVVVYAVGETTGKDYGSATCVISRRGNLAMMYVNGSQTYFATRDTDQVRVAGR